MFTKINKNKKKAIISSPNTPVKYVCSIGCSNEFTLMIIKVLNKSHHVIKKYSIHDNCSLFRFSNKPYHTIGMMVRIDQSNITIYHLEIVSSSQKSTIHLGKNLNQNSIKIFTTSMINAKKSPTRTPNNVK